MNDKTNYGYGIGAVLGALLSLGIVLLYFHFKPDPAPVGVTLDAKPATELKREATVPLAVAVPLQVYKPAVKAKLKLPAAVVADEGTHVVASSKTANDERQHTVTTTIDTNTGKFASYDRVDERPWLAVNTKSEVGAFYGIKNGAPVLRLQAQQEFLQVKAVHLGVTGTIDSDATYFVGAGAWARW